MPLDSKRVSPPTYPESPYADDPDFPRAAEWLKAPVIGDPQALVLGIPFSKLSISGAKCDLLPTALRTALWRFSTFNATHDVDLFELAVTDLGDLILDRLSKDRALTRIRTSFEQLKDAQPVAIIGGDNSISAPAAIGLIGPRAGVITLDAHHDLRDYFRDGPTNGSPVRMMLNQGIAGEDIWQIGIQDFANSSVHSELAKKEGIHVVRAQELMFRDIKDVVGEALLALSDTRGVYVDVDIDVIERALAPGAPAAQPGGLTPEDLAEAAFVCGADPRVKALDIVEVDPEADIGETTVRIAALVLLNFLAGVRTR